MQETQEDNGGEDRQGTGSGAALPRVSVIVPVYNDQRGIDACLDALAHQTYPRALFEIIVVDNGSKPPIRVDAGRHQRAQVVVCGTPGSYAARNAGVAAATGEVLAFTDADCVPDRGWVAAGIAAINLDNRRVIGGEVTVRLPAEPTAVELYQSITGFMQRENVRDRGFTATANLFVTARAMQAIGPFDADLLSGGDREWSWRAGAAGYPVAYAGDAEVVTAPRRSLRAAARQARRVAGGRHGLSGAGAADAAREGSMPHRGPLQSALWILGHPELGQWDRWRVFAVASVLYLVRLAERVRLALGFRPERR